MVEMNFDSALHEREGIEQPAQVNPYLQRKRRRDLSVEDYVAGIRRGDRVILSRAITLIESTHPDHQKVAQQVIEACLPYAGNSLRIGITGVPGAGKSTMTEKVVSCRAIHLSAITESSSMVAFFSGRIAASSLWQASTACCVVSKENFLSSLLQAVKLAAVTMIMATAMMTEVRFLCSISCLFLCLYLHAKEH